MRQSTMNSIGISMLGIGILLHSCVPGAHGALTFERQTPPPASHKWIGNLRHEMESRGVPWDLAYRICDAETGMTLYENSPGAHGEWGPCQMMPRTARPYINNRDLARKLWYVQAALVHPAHGPRIAAEHMAFLFHRYAGNWAAVAAAWNAGQDTGDYTARIMGVEL